MGIFDFTLKWYCNFAIGFMLKIQLYTAFKFNFLFYLQGKCFVEPSHIDDAYVLPRNVESSKMICEHGIFDSGLVKIETGRQNHLIEDQQLFQ